MEFMFHIGLDLFLGRVTRQRLREDSGCGGELGEDFTQAESDHEVDDDNALTPYQILLKMLLENSQGTRAKVAIMHLLQKAHFYELLTTMTARVSISLIIFFIVRIVCRSACKRFHFHLFIFPM